MSPKFIFVILHYTFQLVPCFLYISHLTTSISIFVFPSPFEFILRFLILSSPIPTIATAFLIPLVKYVPSLSLYKNFVIHHRFAVFPTYIFLNLNATLLTFPTITSLSLILITF